MIKKRSHPQDSGNLFPLQKTSKTKNCGKCFSKNIFKIFLKTFSFVGKSHSAKKTKLACYRRNNKLGVSFKMGRDESKLYFLRTSLRFYSALAILERQIYVVVKQFGAKSISLLSGRLVNFRLGPRSKKLSGNIVGTNFPKICEYSNSFLH